MKLRKKLKVFIKNQKDVTGNNLANLIVEREKCSHLRKIKSQPDVFNFIEK